MVSSFAAAARKSAAWIGGIRGRSATLQWRRENRHRRPGREWPKPKIEVSRAGKVDEW